MTNGIKGFLSNPIASYTTARQPGGFLAPSENFRGYFTNPMAHAGSLILQGVPVGQALMQGPLQAFYIQEKFQDREFKKETQEFEKETMELTKKERDDIKNFKELLQDPNFDPQSLEFADLAKVDLGSVVSSFGDELFGDNLIEAYNKNTDSLVYASPLDIKNNSNLIPKDASRFGTSDAGRRDFRYIVTDPTTNKKYNAFDTQDGKVLVQLDDGSEISYSNEMFGAGTQAVISTVGNLARSQLTLPQFLTIKTEVEKSEVQLEKLAQFISRNENLPQGAEKILNQLQSTFKTIFTENGLTTEEFMQRLQAGTFQGLIGANRLEVVGGGVMTEQDAIRIMLALGGDPASAFTNKEVATALISNILADKHRMYEQNLEVYNNEVSGFSGYKIKEGFKLTDAQKEFFDANALLRLDVDSISTMTKDQILRVNPADLTLQQIEEYNKKWIEYFG